MAKQQASTKAENIIRKGELVCRCISKMIDQSDC
jgi:hypothetical protein